METSDFESDPKLRTAANRILRAVIAWASFYLGVLACQSLTFARSDTRVNVPASADLILITLASGNVRASRSRVVMVGLDVLVRFRRGSWASRSSAAGPRLPQSLLRSDKKAGDLEA